MARRAPRKVHAPPQKNHVTDGIPNISPQLSYSLELQQALPEERTLPQTRPVSLSALSSMSYKRVAIGLKDLFPDLYLPLV
jgi:hypothetical protein